jgi:hypothetical protein
MARANLEGFLTGFVLPLVSGGELKISRPLSAQDIADFDHDLANHPVATTAIDDARDRVLSTLVCRPPAIVLEAEDLALAAGLHDALFLAHPRADGWSVSDRQRRRIAETAQALVAQPLSRHRTRVLARHALLHNVFRLTRVDTTVSWWTGRARFLGQRPPSRLTAWKGVRRVREERVNVDFDELLSAPDVTPVVATLLRRTPLTQLLTSHPAAPALHWEDAVFLLRDVELARAIAYELLRSEDLREQVVGPARLAAAFEQMLERAPAEADVRTVAAFLVHLNLLMCSGEIGARDRDRSPLLSTVLAVERAAQRPRGLATLFALPNALAAVDPVLATPPGVGDNPGRGTEAIRARWKIHRRQVGEVVGDAVIETLAARLRRHFRLSLPPPPPPSPTPAPPGPE